MRIVTVRRLCQGFFLVLLLWLCVVSSAGRQWWQLRGWPVNWLIQLDPLTAIGTALATRALPAGLLWALATITLTILLGRFFCGWVCPFGTIHHLAGYFANRAKPAVPQIEANRYRRGQSLKYYILAFLLAAAAVKGLQIGLLDPIPLLQRSVNLVLLAICDSPAERLWPGQRYYQWGWLIGGIVMGAIMANLLIPRFYCRFVCPLGALLGVLGRFSIWRIGKTGKDCTNCGRCEANCEGACSPAGRIRISECVLCMNCVDSCKDGVVKYRKYKSAAGEITNPDISRRGFVLSVVSGLAAVPIVRLGAKIASNWHPQIIRPPGTLAEEDFLARCIKCGQCMRVCPTNVIQPAGLTGGLEGLWTPTLNNRIGTSGCQLNCVSCGNICPTGAIRAISLDEKLGRGEFADAGPISLGTAFVDRGRCLPWAMDAPCIVCQEICPVSPKAIFVREEFVTVRGGVFTVTMGDRLGAGISPQAPPDGNFATGDYYCKPAGSGPHERRLIVRQDRHTIAIDPARPWRQPPAAGSKVEIQIRLHRPYVEPAKCIGCGICEHECPVGGRRAIRVTAENESRSPGRSLIL